MHNSYDLLQDSFNFLSSRTYMLLMYIIYFTYNANFYTSSVLLTYSYKTQEGYYLVEKPIIFVAPTYNVQVCLLTLKNLITLHTSYKISCQGLLITNISLCIHTYKMQKQPGCKKSTRPIRSNIVAMVIIKRPKPLISGT